MQVILYAAHSGMFSPWRDTMIRYLMGIVVLSACGLLALHAAEPVQPKLKAPQIPIPQRGPTQVDPEMPYFLVCAKACDDCARMCETCAAHCAKLLAKGNKEHQVTLQHCQDCAAVCQAAARITAKDGPMSKLICIACADACKLCGDECAKHAEDPLMKKCAVMCQQCEKVCREMVKAPREGDNEKK